MADWFETRFREPVDAGQLDPAFVARMRALVVEEWQADAGAIPAVSTDPDDQEGDIIMLETEDRPTGHEPVHPRRRSPGRWLLVAAAVAVVAVAGTLLVAAGDDDDPVDTVPSDTTPPPPPAGARDVLAVPGAATGFPELEPGPYFIDPDGDDTTPLRVTYEVTEEGWSAWFGAMKFAGNGLTGLSIATVTNVVADGCRDHSPLAPAVGPTVDDLATALSQLAPFQVTAPPTDVSLGGYEGKHLALAVPDSGLTGCVDGRLHSWIAPVNEVAFSGYDGPGQTEEFWILDVEGTRLVLVKFDSERSSPEDIAERDAIFDSIRIEP
jgi:hypothetical protein